GLIAARRLSDFVVRGLGDDSQKQLVVERINDAGERRSACATCQAVALESALVDLRIMAPVNHKRGATARTRDLLRSRSAKCLDGGRNGYFSGHLTSTTQRSRSGEVNRRRVLRKRTETQTRGASGIADQTIASKIGRRSYYLGGFPRPFRDGRL